MHQVRDEPVAGKDIWICYMVMNSVNQKGTWHDYVLPDLLLNWELRLVKFSKRLWIVQSDQSN
jgi:hypothetical protein